MTRPLIALCGLAFSGKSTIARRIAEALGFDLISCDAINARGGFDGGKAIADSEWEKTSLMAAAEVKAAPIAPEVFAHHRDRFQFPGDDEVPVRVANPADLDRWLAAARANIVAS